MALEPATLVPLQLLKSNGTRCIMVGDPKQRPATVRSNTASKFLYECSMFERFQRAGHPVLLTKQIIGDSVAFALGLGLATTLALLGIGTSFAWKAYGQIGRGLPLAASGRFDPHAAAANFPSRVQAYLAGLTFALAASPCSTPVLATLLGYVATSKDPVIGGSLLLTYPTGYVAPLLLAASFARALQWCTSVGRRFVHILG
ncbi:hypothetical protein EZV62_008390 [Acer yangbiense]|uniref:Cytochrome C biogenesis protein transmembrane domain-containing protein n=1 Tax=Acer yangbiense TaxID=1000413 RepID=A0A5C7IDJ9_9ROSI|nr:hypothetical protein EZV62_008390 [Acer yangbiense]